MEQVVAKALGLAPAVSRPTGIVVFKLITTASKTWRRLMGNNQLPKVIEGVRFKDGMQIAETKTRAAA